MIILNHPRVLALSSKFSDTSTTYKQSVDTPIYDNPYDLARLFKEVFIIMLKIFKLCKKYLINNKGLFVLYFFLCIVAGVFSLCTPYISGNFIDTLVKAQNENIIYKYCLFFLIITVFSQIVGYFENRSYTKLQTRMGFELNCDVISHVQKLSLSYIKGVDMAYLNQRINNDSNMIVTFCINIIQGVTINTIKLVLSITVLIYFNKWIAVLLSIVLGLYIFVFILLKKILYEMQYTLTEEKAQYFSKLFEQLNSIFFIKMHAIYSPFLERLKVAFHKVYNITMKYQKLAYLFSTLDSLITSLAQIGIFIIGGSAVIRGQLSIGQLTIILSYFSIMLSSARYFFSITKSIQDNKVAYTRLSELLHKTIDETNGSLLEDINNIRINRVTFSYSNKTLFDDYSYEFKKGKIYAIVGENGTGKTTLINMLVGFFKELYTGDVLYNNISLRKINCSELRKRHVSVCEQEPTLINDTIKRNITLYDDKQLDTNKMKIIANYINLHVFMKNLDSGLDTLINDKSSNLSGGERQKIALLRSLFKDSSIIILDEPTSALDEISREGLRNYLLKIKKSKIIILVTHDQKLIDISDELIKLD